MGSEGRQCKDNLVLYSILLFSEPYLLFDFCVDLRLPFLLLHYMHKMVGAAKQAVM